MTTPAEQYRALVSKLEAIQEDQALPVAVRDPQNIGQMTAQRGSQVIEIHPYDTHPSINPPIERSYKSQMQVMINGVPTTVYYDPGQSEPNRIYAYLPIAPSVSQLDPSYKGPRNGLR